MRRASPGPGQEFLDHRHFHHGDDFRAVNWRAFLRFEKLLLKMFQVEPRIPVRILLDTSASMGTGDSAEVRLCAKTRRGPDLRRPGAARHRVSAGVFDHRWQGPVTAAAAAIAFFPQCIS